MLIDNTIKMKAFGAELERTAERLFLKTVISLSWQFMQNNYRAEVLFVILQDSDTDDVPVFISKNVAPAAHAYSTHSRFHHGTTLNIYVSVG